MKKIVQPNTHRGRGINFGLDTGLSVDSCTEKQIKAYGWLNNKQ